MRKKKAIRVKIFIFIFIAIILWLLFFTKNNFFKILKDKIKLEQRSQKIAELKENKKQLEKEYKKLLDQDSTIMEKKAREIGMAKEGEVIIRISEDEKANDLGKQSEGTNDE
ncbi:MAG: septum formation initiator family protein [Candidatus Cloacimonetes bacterium]|nr:septum formation initiator family protein [Candidatus Cloacimonadota bacterium]MBS3766784.1 septum formation initiator family protein [Candidatus Cloacimonadota bacterium]